MMPSLSVIVPVYNTKKYLRECIDSILAAETTGVKAVRGSCNAAQKREISVKTAKICGGFWQISVKIRVDF